MSYALLMGGFKVEQLLLHETMTIPTRATIASSKAGPLARRRKRAQWVPEQKGAREEEAKRQQLPRRRVQSWHEGRENAGTHRALRHPTYHDSGLIFIRSQVSNP